MILASASTASLLTSLVAALAYALPALLARRLDAHTARIALAVAWVLHGLSLVMGLLGEGPRFGFAPSISVTAWVAMTVYMVESQIFPQLQARWALASLGALAVLLALVFPGSALHVNASPWLPLHWALGIASYGLFAAAVVHAWLMTRAEKQMRLASQAPAGMPLLTLERLTFRFVSAGFMLLSATLLAGVFFGEQLYGVAASGRALVNHKTIFAVLSWVTFAVLLAGRRRFGWRGRKAVRFLYIGAGLLMLSYAGSRFVLEVVLGRAA
jgi:ABC-type uncharacterized transport system permease subunit